jgi:tetratricopeptide (TPR) repeat protein
MANQYQPASVLKCPNNECGIVLREKGIEAFAVVFPTTFEAIKSLLSKTIDKAKCPSCETIVAFDPVVCFAHIPAEKVWFYIPERVLLEYPLMIEEMHKSMGLISHEAEGEWISEYVKSIDELTDRAIELLRSGFANIFNDYSFAKIDGTTEEKWLKRNMDRLNYEFFTSLQLVIEEALPINLQVAVVPDTTDAHQLLTKDVLEELLAIRVRFVNQRLVNTIGELLAKGNLSELAETLDITIPECVIDDLQISSLASIVESCNGNIEISGQLQYSLEAGLAWAAHQKSLPNPRADSWSAHVANLELQLAIGDEGASLSRLIMPDKFLRETLNFRLLWDQIAFRFKQIDRGASEKARKEITILSNLAERLGWDDEISELFSEMHKVTGLDEAQPALITLWFETLLKTLNKEGGLGAFAKGLRETILATRLEEAAEGLQKAVHLLGEARLDDATYLMARYSQALNESSFSEQAAKSIKWWVDELKESTEWERVKSSRRIDLLNEYGNAKRYLGKPKEAIAIYEEALAIGGKGISESQRVTLIANLGRVYRDAGRLFDGIAYLKQSLKETDPPTQKAQTLHSLAICYGLLGNDTKALELIDQADNLLRSTQPKAFARQRAPILLSKLKALTDLNQMAEADQAFLEILEIADKVLRDPLLLVQASFISIDISDNKERVKYREILKHTREIAEKFLALEIGISTTVRSFLLIKLAELALIEKEYLTFWDLMSKAEQISEGLPTDQWRICALKSQAALHEGRVEESYGYLREAWRYLLGRYMTENVLKVPLTFAEDREALQRQTSKIIWTLYEGKTVPASHLVVAAELQNAVLQNLVLGTSEQILVDYRDAPLSEDWMSHDLKLLVESGSNNRPIVFLHFLHKDAAYYPLITIYTESVSETFVPNLPIPTRFLKQCEIEFSYAVKTYNPASERDPLDTLGKWHQFSATIANLIRQHVPSGSHICVIPGPGVSRLPVHLCTQRGQTAPLITDYTFSYAPSLFALARLRQRRLTETHETTNRPRTLGNFVVWQAGENPIVIDSFRKHSKRVIEIGESMGRRVQFAEATNATQDSLNDMMINTDLLHLCCHGVVSLMTGTHRLLVSDGKTLPPSDRRALGNPFNDPFFLDWDEIMAQNSPTVVISCSCSSGMVSMKPGGERVGFERTLFQRGTSSFIAPLWDVSVFDIHHLVETVLSNYSSGEMDLSQAVRESILHSLDAGRPAHSVGALALIGDWI